MTERLFRARRGRGLVPVLVEEGLSVGDGRVSGQHAKRGRLPRPVHPQQAETLTNREGALSYSSNVTEMHVTEEEGGVRASCSPQVKQPSPINYAAFHNVNYRHMHILYECILLLQYLFCCILPLPRSSVLSQPFLCILIYVFHTFYIQLKGLWQTKMLSQLPGGSSSHLASWDPQTQPVHGWRPADAVHLRTTHTCITPQLRTCQDHIQDGGNTGNVTPRSWHWYAKKSMCLQKEILKTKILKTGAEWVYWRQKKSVLVS